MVELLANPAFVEQRIESRFQRRLIPVPRAGLDELSERPPGDNSHAQKMACAHFGHKLCVLPVETKLSAPLGLGFAD